MPTIKNKIKKTAAKLGLQISRSQSQVPVTKKTYNKYRSYTMIPEQIYIDNLDLCLSAIQIDGSIYECGVWKGGMIAGIAELMGKNRKHYLFDSFEGLPEAKEIDGENAIQWQQDKDNPTYFDNCKAEEDFAKKAMNLTGVEYTLVKGWFEETVPTHLPDGPIAILRLDGDWYESTYTCLSGLYPYVNTNGLVILDDYYAWDGCSKAVHDYLSSINSSSRIHKTANGVAYIIKKEHFGN